MTKTKSKPKKTNRPYTPEDEKHLMNWRDWASNKTEAARSYVQSHDSKRSEASVWQKISCMEKQNGIKSVDVRQPGKKKDVQVKRGIPRLLPEQVSPTQSVVASRVMDATLGFTNIKLVTDGGEVTVVIPSRRFSINEVKISWGYDDIPRRV